MLEVGDDGKKWELHPAKSHNFTKNWGKVSHYLVKTSQLL